MMELIIRQAKFNKIYRKNMVELIDKEAYISKDKLGRETCGRFN
jgi:hypothetical protein